MQAFWQVVGQQIALITGHTMLLQPSLALLNLWETPAPDPLLRELIELCLTATRTVIAFHWKSTKPLTINDWYLRLWNLSLQDKISIAILRAENQKVPNNFQEKWLPLLDAFSFKHVDVSLFNNHTYFDLLSYF